MQRNHFCSVSKLIRKVIKHDKVAISIFFSICFKAISEFTFQPLHPAHLPPPSPPWSPSTSALAKAAFLLFPGSSFTALFTESGSCLKSKVLGGCWTPATALVPFPVPQTLLCPFHGISSFPHPDGDLLSLHFAPSCLRPSGDHTAHQQPAPGSQATAAYPQTPA